MTDLENPYRMLPSDDGGESYRMECTFCLEEGNIMSKFIHTPDCPAGKREQVRFEAMRTGKDDQGRSLGQTSKGKVRTE